MGPNQCQAPSTGGEVATDRACCTTALLATGALKCSTIGAPTPTTWLSPGVIVGLSSPDGRMVEYVAVRTTGRLPMPRMWAVTW